MVANTPFANLYKWNAADTKQTTITESSNNADKIDTKLSEIQLKEMFPNQSIINLNGMTVGDIVLTRTKVALGTITLA